MEEKEEEEVERLRENSKLEESWFAPLANYLFLCTLCYSSPQLRWSCAGTSWSTCWGSSAGAGGRAWVAAPAWWRSSRTSTCTGGGGEMWTSSFLTTSIWIEGEETLMRRRWKSERGKSQHIAGDVEISVSPQPAACPPAHCGSSDSPAEQDCLQVQSSLYSSFSTNLTWTFLQNHNKRYYNQSKNHFANLSCTSQKELKTGNLVATLSINVFTHNFWRWFIEADTLTTSFPIS